MKYFSWESVDYFMYMSKIYNFYKWNEVWNVYIHFKV